MYFPLPFSKHLHALNSAAARTTTVAAIALTSMAALSATSQAHAGELEKIKAAGSITIAYRESAIPFSYLDANKRPIGYTINLCSRIADAIRAKLQMAVLPVEYLSVTSSSRFTAITEGKASLECGSTINNAERRKLVDFAIPHYIAAGRLLSLASNNIKTVQDLNGKSVISTQGSPSLAQLNRINAERVIQLDITSSKDHQEGFNAVASGKAQAFAMDDVVLANLRAHAKEPSKYAITGRPLGVEAYAIMLPKDDAAFKKVVNQEIQRMIRSGELQVIYSKWFEKPIAPDDINMNWPMPYLLRESLRFPTDQIGN